MCVLGLVLYVLCPMVSLHLLASAKWQSLHFQRQLVVVQCLARNISASVRDRGMVSMDHLQETICWESNGHATDDVS